MTDDGPLTRDEVRLVWEAMEGIDWPRVLAKRIDNVVAAALQVDAYGAQDLYEDRLVTWEETVDVLRRALRALAGEGE